MFNELTIIGYLAKDPVSIPTTEFPKTIVTVLSNKKYKKKDGTQGRHDCPMDCELYNGFATTAMMHLKRGSLVLLTGFLALEKWTVFDPVVGREVEKAKYLLKVDKMQMLPTAREDSPSTFGTNQRSNNQMSYGYEDLMGK